MKLGKNHKTIITSSGIVLLLLLGYYYHYGFFEQQFEYFDIEHYDIKDPPKEHKLFLLLTTRSSKSYNSDSKIWKDMSHNNNDLKWKSIPPNKSGNMIITTQKGELKTKSKPNHKDFSIFIECKTVRSVNMNNSEVLFIPGNERDGVKFNLDNEYGKINLTIADHKIGLTKKIMTNDMNMYTIVKDKDLILVYVNGNLLEKTKLKKKIYFSDEPITINSLENSNFELQTVAIYNNSMNSSEVSSTSTYLKKITPPKVSNNKDVGEGVGAGVGENKCTSLCQEECASSGNYKDCYETCAYRIPECKKFCKKNPTRPICNTKCKDYDKCPTSYIKDGSYYVYIVKDSIYAKELGRHGEISYGRDRANAKEIYSMNFPDCKMPKVLDEYSPNPTNDSCPFVIKHRNPCKSKNCRDVDWGTNPLNADVNKKCKKNVASYCEENADKDKACYCWKPKYQDDRYCSKFRRHFDDQKCSPSQFDINEHPDFSEYIKKDNIPCWNCNISSKPKK
tara:strand:- start:8969 stop:10486 length:1518 start_codon:yes stop_codon:yes gene_type:complete